MAFDPHSLALFQSVADSGSIAGAAARTGVAASAISKRVADLEAQSGTALLLRHRRGIELTAAGRLILKHAEALERLSDRIRSDLCDHVSGSSGAIRLAANTSAITQFLPEDLAEFLRTTRDVKIHMSELSSVEIIEAVRNDSVDIGIFSGFTDARGLAVLPYRRDTLVLTAPKGHPLANRTSVRLRDLDGERMVALQAHSSLQSHVDKLARDLGITLHTMVEVKSFDGVRRMVQAGLGIAILPHGAVAEYLDNASLAMVPINERWATRDLFIAVRDTTALDPQTQALLRTLQG